MTKIIKERNPSNPSIIQQVKRAISPREQNIPYAIADATSGEVTDFSLYRTLPSAEEVFNTHTSFAHSGEDILLLDLSKNKVLKRYKRNPMHPLEVISHISTAAMGANSMLELNERLKKRRRNPFDERSLKYYRPQLIAELEKHGEVTTPYNSAFGQTASADPETFKIEIAGEFGEHSRITLKPQRNSYKQALTNETEIEYRVMWGAYIAGIYKTRAGAERAIEKAKIKHPGKDLHIEAVEVYKLRRNSYKRTPQAPLHVHDYEREYASGEEGEVTDYWRGKRGRGAHPRVHPTPRPNSTRLVGGKWSTTRDAERLAKLEALRYEAHQALDVALANDYPQSAVRAYARKLAQLESRIKKQRGRMAANPATSTTLNKLSRMFHGEHNKHFGKLRNVVASSRVRSGEVARIGALPYIKLRNRLTNNGQVKNGQNKHDATSHACPNCAVVFNPRTTSLAMTTGKRLVIAGAGAQAVGRRLRSRLVRANPELEGHDIDLGAAEVIGYSTEEKHSPSGQMILYYHEAAEETGDENDMFHVHLDPDGMPFIPQNSGNYDIDERGIIN